MATVRKNYDINAQKKNEEDYSGSPYISNVEIPRVPQSAPLGVSKTKSLYNAMVRQSFLLCCRDARV